MLAEGGGALLCTHRKTELFERRLDQGGVLEQNVLQVPTALLDVAKN